MARHNAHRLRFSRSIRKDLLPRIQGILFHGRRYVQNTPPTHASRTYAGARRDAHGYYWITGRVDDLMNVSGHLLSTAEIESALVAHPSVAEAAVVAAPDHIKGHTPYAFVTLVQVRLLMCLSTKIY